MVALEIAVQDAAGAQIALEAGADRVELCSALGLTGGITPSAAVVSSVIAVGIPVHVLVRCRPGGFVYTQAEIELMCQDIESVVEAGAAGVVIGALKEDRTVAMHAVEQMIKAARGAAKAQGRSIEVTFHRALDVCDKPVEQLRELAILGVDRVLTSGGAPKAPEGTEVLKALVAAQTGVQIMAGGGVSIESIPQLVQLGVHAVHLSAKAERPDPGPAGPGGGREGGIEYTNPSTVHEAVQALARAK